jgi:hypothetical protein
MSYIKQINVLDMFNLKPVKKLAFGRRNINR